MIPTCEFLSPFHFDEHEAMLNFRLGNQNYSIVLFELNDVFHFPKDQDAMIDFNRHDFWREITGQRHVFYEPRLAKELKI